MATHNEFGKLAEKKAAEFLIENGYHILQHNYRYQKAEIDLIAEYGNQIVFVEVKARSTSYFSQPYEAVNPSKIKLIIKGSNAFLEELNSDKEARFDIISILRNTDGSWEINHIEDAFNAIDDN